MNLNAHNCVFKFYCVVDVRSHDLRLEFRRLVRMYGADLCFTPMTMTDSFCQSEKARQVEFSTSEGSLILLDISCITFIAIMKM